MSAPENSPPLYDDGIILPLQPDPNEIKRIYQQAYVDSNLYHRDASGFAIPHEKGLPARVELVMREQFEVHNSSELVANGATKQRLYAACFPFGPGVGSLPETKAAEVAQKQLATKCWNIVQTQVGGWLQKRVRGEHGLFVCQSVVPSTKITKETGFEEPSSEMARYLTSDVTLIMEYWIRVRGEKVAGLVDSINADFQEAIHRNHALAKDVSKYALTLRKTMQDKLLVANMDYAMSLTSGITGEEEVAG